MTLDAQPDQGSEPLAAITVTAESRAAKRHLGPTAWAILEDVALDARPSDGRWEARTSVRLVARHLGLTPGTVARALARLCSEGLVHREDRRDIDTGRFGESVYVVDPLPALAPCVDSPHTDRRATVLPNTAKPQAEKRHAEAPPVLVPPAAGGRARRAEESGQLPLLGADSEFGAPTPCTPSTTNAESPTGTNPEAHTTQPTKNESPKNEPPRNQPLNPITQRPSNTCQPFGRALPGRASC